MPEVIRRTGLCRARKYDRIKRREFPSPVKVGTSSMWVESEISAWILDTIAAARSAEKKKPASVGRKRVEPAA
jgi:prophage regulatory protein